MHRLLCGLQMTAQRRSHTHTQPINHLAVWLRLPSDQKWDVMMILVLRVKKSLITHVLWLWTWWTSMCYTRPRFSFSLCLVFLFVLPGDSKPAFLCWHPVFCLQHLSTAYWPVFYPAPLQVLLCETEPMFFWPAVLTSVQNQVFHTRFTTCLHK